jgi:hypothetical protein
MYNLVYVLHTFSDLAYTLKLSLFGMESNQDKLGNHTKYHLHQDNCNTKPHCKMYEQILASFVKTCRRFEGNVQNMSKLLELDRK